MQCLLWEIGPTLAFPIASATPKTKQKMPQQFQFLGNCRRRGAGRAGRCSFKTLNMNTGCGYSLHFRASALHAQHSSRVLSPEEEEEGRMGAEDCSFLPGGSIRNTVSLTPETDADLCHSESRLNIQWSPHCIPAVYLTGQIYLFINFYYFKGLSKYATFLSRVLQYTSWFKSKMADLSVWPLWLIYLLRIQSPAVVLKRLGFWEMTFVDFLSLARSVFRFGRTTEGKKFWK